tara:strand:- start:76 stop:6402 length:6327 start_codon:yes stop_codon:yes gene_type:complete
MANKKIFTGYTFEGGGQSKNLRLEAATSSPTNVGKGHAYYDTTAGTIKVSNADADATDSWKTLLTTDSSIAASQVDLSNVDAVTLDGKDTSTTAVADKIPIYGTGGVLPVAAPTADGHAANKGYVDTVAQGLSIKTAVDYATSAALSASTYVNGSSFGAGATLTADNYGTLQVDGTFLNDENLRILVKDQADASENGVYTLTTVGNSNTAWVLTRATDFDITAEINDGDFFFVHSGTSNASKGFVQTKNLSGASAVGTADIVFEQFSEAGNLEVYSQAGTADASKTAGPLVQVGNDVTFGYNDTHFAVDTNGNLKLASGGSGTGISSALLQDDAVTPAKLDDDGAFLMGRLGIGAGNSSGGALGIQHGAANQVNITHDGASTNEWGLLLGHGNGSASGTYHGLDNAAVINVPNAPLHLGTNNVAIMTLASGKVLVGRTDTPSSITPSGTLHVSTARYGSHLITGDYSDYSVADEAASTASKYGWSRYGDNTIAVTSEQLVVAYAGGSNAGSGAYRYIRASNNAADLVIGKSYKVSIDLKYSGSGSAPQVRVYNGSSYESSFGTLTTSLATYTTTFEAAHATNAFIAFTTLGSGQSITIDNLTIQEDTLSTSANLSVDGNADDLVIANNADAGLTLMTPHGNKGRIFFGSRGYNAHSRIFASLDSNNDSTLIFSASDNGTAGTVMTLFGNDKSAKFAGGLGVGTAETTAGTITAKADGGRIKLESDDFIIAALSRQGTSGSALDQGSLTLYNAGNAKIELLSNGTSYFHSGNVAIGDTAASAKLEVITTSNTDGIQIRRASANETSTALLGFRTSSGANATNTSSIAAVRTNLPNAGDNKLVFQTQASGALAEHLTIDGYGTHDHKSNSIVNSASIAGLQDGGACYDFDGTGDKITIADDGAFDFEDFTVALWLNANTFSNNDRIITKGSTGNGEWMISAGTSNKIRVYAKDAAGNAKDTSGDFSAITTNQWNYVVVVIDRTNDKIRLSLNGGAFEDFVGGTDWTSNFANSSGIQIGTNGSTHFDGQIRDVKIFPSALDDGDIRKLYSGENPKKNLNVELVEGGQFNSASDITDNNPDNWRGETDGGSNTVTMSVVSGEMEVTSAASASTVAYATVTTVVGKAYLFSVDARTGTSAAALIRIGTGVGSSTLLNTTATTQETINATFVATSTTTYISLGANQAGSKTAYFDNVSLTEVGTLVDFTPQSASSTQWRNEAIPSLFHGTVNNATLSQGNSYWNNIKQDGDKVLLLPKAVSNGSITTARLGIGIDDPAVVSAPITLRADQNTPFLEIKDDINADKSRVSFEYNYSGTDRLDINIHHPSKSTVMSLYEGDDVKVHGKLGVGTAADASIQMTVGGAGSQVMQVKSTNSHASVQIDRKNATADANLMLMTNGVSKWRFATGLAGDEKLSIYDDIADTNMMTFESGVGVAIGHTAPTKDLHIKYNSNNSADIAGSGLLGGNLGNGLLIQNEATNYNSYTNLDFRSNNADGRIAYEYKDSNTGAFHFVTDNFGNANHILELEADGTQDHKGNRIVNSQTLNDSWRTSEPSLRFDGSNDYVQVPIATASHYDAKAVSIWFKPSAAITNNTSGQWLIGFDDSSYQPAIVLGSTTTSITNELITVWDGGAKNCYASATASISAEWHHLVATYNATSSHWDIYLDGVVVDNAYNGTANTSINVEQILIGARPDQTGNRFNGEIKDVRIHNRALDADEVKGLYNGESTPWEYTTLESIHTSNFSSGANGYNGSGGTSTGENDAVLSQEDDCLKFVVDSSNGPHQVIKSITATTGRTYKISGKIYIPSGNTDVNAVQINEDGNGDENVFTTITTTGSWVNFSGVQTWSGYGELRFRALKAQSTHSYTGNGSDEFYLKDVELEEAGEVAAYTPKSIGKVWNDTTSNRNNGAITGATRLTGNNRIGPLSEDNGLKIHASANNEDVLRILPPTGYGQNANQFLNILSGDSASSTRQGLRFGMNSGNKWDVQLSSYHRISLWTGNDVGNTNTEERFRIEDGGEVKASNSQGNLKQVARVHTQNIEGNGEDKDFTITHNLGTADIVVSVRSKTYPLGHVEVDVLSNGDDGSDANNPMTKCTIRFATAPASGENFRATIIG